MRPGSDRPTIALRASEAPPPDPVAPAIPPELPASPDPPDIPTAPIHEEPEGRAVVVA